MRSLRKIDISYYEAKLLSNTTYNTNIIHKLNTIEKSFLVLEITMTLNLEEISKLRIQESVEQTASSVAPRVVAHRGVADGARQSN